MRIKDITEDNRPRERFRRLGPKALSDAEILAIILRNGTCGENVVDMSNRLIAQYGIDRLSTLSLKELQKIKGIGPAKAMQILALFEFNRRHGMSQKRRTPIRSARDVYEYAKDILPTEDKEYFMILCLDTKNRVIKDETVSVGTLNSSLVHPREVFKPAIKESANTVILVHNHPSGDPTPSREDKQITETLFEAGELLDITVIDHVIIGNGDCYSFRENRLL